MSPPGSPDLNPIENVWGSIINTVLSKLCKVSTSPGLCQNWNKLLNTNEAHTSSLLSIHIHKLLPTIIVEVEGEPSGF